MIRWYTWKAHLILHSLYKVLKSYGYWIVSDSSFDATTYTKSYVGTVKDYLQATIESIHPFIRYEMEGTIRKYLLKELVTYYYYLWLNPLQELNG